MTRAREAGFTLIETLIALSVLAVSSMAFLAATEAHVARVGGLETRAMALLAAQNHLAEAALGLAPAPRATLLGIEFAVTSQTTDTADAALRRLDIAVAHAATGQVHARLTGFVADRAGGAP